MTNFGVVNIDIGNMYNNVCNLLLLYCGSLKDLYIANFYGNKDLQSSLIFLSVIY